MKVRVCDVSNGSIISITNPQDSEVRIAWRACPERHGNEVICVYVLSILFSGAARGWPQLFAPSAVTHAAVLSPCLIL